MKRVMVTGGRAYDNEDTVRAVFESLIREHGKDFVLIHGDARGADSLCKREAARRGIHYATVPALWDIYNRPAGHLRNAAMVQLLEPDLVISFPGGRGTASALGCADKANLPIWIISDDIVSYRVNKINCEPDE